MSKPISVGLIGAGYIATWHAEALKDTRGVALTAICDLDESAAQGLAAQFGARAFASVEDLIASGLCDAVHILTPPHLHADLAIRCMEGGLDVLVEKPVSESAEQARAILSCAERTGRRFSPGHNFLGLPSYERMKAAVMAGDYGRISTAEITWALPLAPLRSGPFNLWLLRSPKNLMLELGPHPFAFAQDLFGEIEVLSAQASYPIDLPGKDPRPQAFRILARAGGVDVTFHLSMVEVIDDRSVTLRGSAARARLDYAADVLVVERENADDLILNPLKRQRQLARQRSRAGWSNGWVQLRSLNTLNPYGRSFRGMNAAIYQSATKEVSDSRLTGTSAVAVMRALDDAIAALPADQMAVAAPAVQSRQPKPTALVIGGTGFIGRALTRRLVAEGRDVRVLSRGRTGPFPDLPDQVETVGVALDDLDGLTDAMRGMDVVFNLAKALENSWEAALRNDVGVALRIADAAEAAGVKRLVYTGTIASYDMSDPKTRITEATPFPEDMSDRNLYARSKAECERRLLERHAERGLPLVIARPGIVVGPGGPLQHWGIGRWHGSGAVRIWGHGRNILPFVLNDDVADGLVRMIDADVEGESFNLVGDPMLSAQGYFAAIRETLGARIDVQPGNLHAFFAGDAVKYALKKYGLRKPSLVRPSLADWKSRAHFSRFVNDKPKRVLGWTPEANEDAFVRRAIGESNVFGF